MASWQNVLELDPSYSDASLALARTYAVQGRYEQAIAELQKALVFNERQPLLLRRLAHAYARAGQREKALTLAAEMNRIEARELRFTAQCKLQKGHGVFRVRSANVRA
jgi:predicted Zn-dependent protease